MADSANTTEVFQSAEFYEEDSLGTVARLGLSPLVALTMFFDWVDLPQRWLLLIAMAVIISVLPYMGLLVRR